MHQRHVHIWEVDVDGRGRNYYVVNEMSPDLEVIDHDVDENLTDVQLVELFPDCTVTVHYIDGFYTRHAKETNQ